MFISKTKKLLNGILAITLIATVSSGALAEDIEIAGTYGSYLKPDCRWVSNNEYNTGGGGTVITVRTLFLTCAAEPPYIPEAVKTEISHYRNGVYIPEGSSCSISSAMAMVEGSCAGYRVFK